MDVLGRGTLEVEKAPDPDTLPIVASSVGFEKLPSSDSSDEFTA